MSKRFKAPGSKESTSAMSEVEPFTTATASDKSIACNSGVSDDTESRSQTLEDETPAMETASGRTDTDTSLSKVAQLGINNSDEGDRQEAESSASLVSQDGRETSGDGVLDAQRILNRAVEFADRYPRQTVAAGLAIGAAVGWILTNKSARKQAAHLVQLAGPALNSFAQSASNFTAGVQQDALTSAQLQTH